MYLNAIRLASFVALTLTGLAILIGRHVPAPDLHRRPADTRLIVIRVCKTIDGVSLAAGGMPFNRRKVPVLDLATGEVKSFGYSETDLVNDCHSWSSWLDDGDERQMVARWKRPPERMDSEKYMGLARYTYPGHRLIDWVACERVPTEPPTWIHGGAARLVYPCQDGELYRFDFEGPDGMSILSTGVETEPRRLPWRCPCPGGTNNVWNIGDVSCPASLPSGPWLLVTLSFRDRDTQLWWLRLRPDGDAVVAAGRILRATPAEPRGGLPSGERFAQLSRLPDGRLVLAYLVEHGSRTRWELRAAPVEIDPITEGPVADASESVSLAEGGFLMNPPAFSPDGRWVYAFRSNVALDARLVRFVNPLAVSGQSPTRLGVARRRG